MGKLPTSSNEDLIKRAKEVIAANIGALESSLISIDETFLAVCRILVNCQGKILVTGSGTSGTVAQRTAHLFSAGGTPAFFLSPADGLHGGLGVLRHNDVVLALSKGGGSAELNEFCTRARTLSQSLVVITATADTPLAAIADQVIRLNLEANADLGTVVATGSSLAAAAVCDALVEVTRILHGYGWEDFFFTHPAGAIGRDAADTLSHLSEGK